jgi:hypothetical protein
VYFFIGLVLAGGAGITLADVPEAAAATETVVVVATSERLWDCREATPARARWLADQASREGAYQRAGECYLAAGEQALADQSFGKAAAQTSPDTTRRLAANLDEVKAQARQVKVAFRHR